MTLFKSDTVGKKLLKICLKVISYRLCRCMMIGFVFSKNQTEERCWEN